MYQTALNGLEAAAFQLQHCMLFANRFFFKGDRVAQHLTHSVYQLVGIISTKGKKIGR